MIPATTASNTAAEIAKRTTSYGWDMFDRLFTVSQPVAGSTVKQTFNYSYDYRTRRTMVRQVAHRTVRVKYTAVALSGGVSVAEDEKTLATAPVGQGTTAVTEAHLEYTRGPDMGGGVGGLLYSARTSGGAAGQGGEAGPSAAVVKYNLSNGRGDIVAQTDSSGALTWTASYEAFGKRTKETGLKQDKLIWTPLRPRGCGRGCGSSRLRGRCRHRSFPGL